MTAKHAYPDHFLNSTERKIVDKIITDALAAGYLISVFDGEAWALKPSSDYVVITADIAATDMTQLRFRKDGKVIGSVLLIHGNGADVIADHHDNDEMNALLAPAFALAETLA